MNKHLIYCWMAIWLLVPGGIRAQLSPTPNRNYTTEQVPRTAQTAVSAVSSYTDVPATVSYFDGLGRPRQTIQVRGSGDASKDIATQTQTYDAYGRPQQTYLPLPGANAGGAVQDGPQGSGQSFYGDSSPFSETYYEPSPLNRPRQQYGAGQAWRSANRSMGIRYGVPPANTVLRFKVNFFSSVIYATIEGGSDYDYFGAHDISTRTTTDEQNNVVVEYTDLQGRLIRRDVQTNGQTLTTMYVYDQYERLGAVIPPKLYDWFVANGSGQALYFYLNGDPAQPNPQFKDNCFAYLYDARGRVIRKHIPSAGWTDLVYDRQDRPVLSQDGQDRAGSQWRYTRYDGLSRPRQTGRTFISRSATDLRTDFAGVSHEDFPGTVSTPKSTLLIENQYDDYVGSPLTYNFQIPPYPNARGLLTRLRTRNLETQVWYESAMWYDDKARVLERQMQNHLGDIDQVDNQYRFNGELIQSLVSEEGILNNQTVGSSAKIIYQNDHWGRPVNQLYDVLDGQPFNMARYQYDAIGRLAQKQLQPQTGSGNGQPVITRNQTPPIPTQDVASQYIEITPENFDVNLQNNPSGLYEARIGGGSSGVALQTLDYRYHIRGWLRGINADAAGQPVLNSSRGDVFAVGLEYETAGYYDGNIGRQRWLGSRQPNQTRQYSYSYDGAKRISAATYAGAPGENYALSGMSYDANGNILSLNRANIDQLSYGYGPGNSLLSVSDASGNSQGFTDGNTSGDDYAYWPEGSIKKDLNRGISDIQYNLLKLPRQVSFTNGNLVSYQYESNATPGSGRKLRMSTSTGQQRDYLTQTEYLNGTFAFQTTPEGRVYVGTNHAGTNAVYEYFLRDHLGNVRAIVRDSSGVAVLSQRTDYEPWGLELAGLSYQNGSQPNRYKFNGQESLAEIGANYLDFGARGYDATIGRMHQVEIWK